MKTQQAVQFLIAVALAGSAVAQTGWSQLLPATQPPPRGFHAIAYDLLRGTTVMFGGWDSAPLADTWEWAGVNWSPRLTANSPSPRCCNALAFDLSHGRIVLFGGTDGTSVDLNDTWEYDGIDWTQRQPVNRPSPRREARMAYDIARGSVLLFGGGVGSTGLPVFADSWEWNGTDWMQHNPATSPPARWSHAMTHDLARGRIVLFGGSAAGNAPALADTWTWNGTNWASVIAAPAPPANRLAGIAYDTTRDLVVVFGGILNGGETWLFDGASWRRDPRPTALSPRASTLAYDIVRGRTVLFGGYAGASYLRDTWQYDPGVISGWVPFGAGCAGTAGVPTLRALGGSLPIVGSTFGLELLSVPANGVAAFTIGFSNQQWGANLLPWSLGALGMPGCTMHASPDFLFFVAVAAGRATLAWPLPNDPGLVGVRFFDQAVFLDPGVNAMGAIVSNAGAGVIGPF